MVSIPEIAAATTAVLAPFLPYLIDASKAGGQKLVDLIASKGGEAAWATAEKLWELIKSSFADAPAEGPEVNRAAMVLADNPEAQSYQTVMATALGNYLMNRPELREQLLNSLGGTQPVQKVLAERNSWVEDITQEISRTGKQIVHASDGSVIIKVKQTQQ